MPSQEEPTVGEVIDLVKAYAKQETLGPLRGAGRWLLMGTVGAFLIGVGLFFVLLGLLRLIQTQWPETFDGAWAWAPHAIVFGVALVVVALAISRVKKSTLAKEPR